MSWDRKASSAALNICSALETARRYPLGFCPEIATMGVHSNSRMNDRRYRLIQTLLLILIAPLLLVPSARAQQQQPPSSPQSAKQTPKTQTATSDQEKKKKSDLEKETGTVNDRIFEVMPNYGTVESTLALPPISSGQKFRLATAGVTDYFTYPFIGFLAALDQANDSPKSWGQGWGAYGKRYGASYADNGIGTYMTTAIFPSLLHEDPRYYEMKKGGFSHRAYYSLNRLFVARTDSGNSRFNYSEIVGNAAAAGISNIYHAPEDRTLSRNLGTWGMLIMWDGVSNEMKEFWPDIRRKVFHKTSP